MESGMTSGSGKKTSILAFSYGKTDFTGFVIRAENGKSVVVEAPHAVRLIFLKLGKRYLLWALFTTPKRFIPDFAMRFKLITPGGVRGKLYPTKTCSEGRGKASTRHAAARNARRKGSDLSQVRQGGPMFTNNGQTASSIRYFQCR